MEKDETCFIRLRYCFAAGYTLPQYCIDNGIKKPLFVLDKESSFFLREIYAQFRYDGRLLAQFCLVGSEEKIKLDLSLSLGVFWAPLTLKNISAMKFEDFDRIILLTKSPLDIGGEKIISFDDVEKFCMQQTYVDIPVLNFLQRHPNVKFVLTSFPDIRQYKGGNELRLKLPTPKMILKKLQQHAKTPFDKFGYTSEEITALLKRDRSRKNLDGTTSLIDDKHPLMQIHDGKRKTAYQPVNYSNKIYFFGPCHYFGRNAPFDKTIESYLQKMLNENNLPYRVENEGQAFVGRSQDMFYNLNALDLFPGDIIFMYLWNLRSNNTVIPFCDVMTAFESPHNYREIFCITGQTGHINELGYKILAERYFEFLNENNFFRDADINLPPTSQPIHRYGIPPQFEAGGLKNFSNPEIDAYKKSLRAKKLPIGAIVMNCNPFTLGHQYLVEYAAAKVARLYIFVVEEDRSEFPFKDRIELVREGVKHIPNVEVLPSGKFIISQTTFSGYFNKAELQDVAVDSSEDVEIFGKEIAPVLGITIRFAGEEPTDNVTRQYNETMKRILPRYGIEFHEIPRKVLGEEIISASKVREALHAGDFDKIKQLVPATTYDYLRGSKKTDGKR